jgi:hypothetical protein
MDKVKVSFLIMFLPLFLSSAFAADNNPTWYNVDSAKNGNRFRINDFTFVSDDYCFGVRAGDKVRFIEGGPRTGCSVAKFQNQRTGKVCNVKCY